MTRSIHPAAQQELNEAFEYYQTRDGKLLARSFLDEIQRVAALLEFNPTFGIIIRGTRRRFLLKRFPFLLIYRIGHPHNNVFCGWPMFYSISWMAGNLAFLALRYHAVVGRLASMLWSRDKKVWANHSIIFLWLPQIFCQKWFVAIPARCRNFVIAIKRWSAALHVSA